jgi:hypothetical protein
MIDKTEKELRFFFTMGLKRSWVFFFFETIGLQEDVKKNHKEQKLLEREMRIILQLLCFDCCTTTPSRPDHIAHLL